MAVDKLVSCSNGKEMRGRSAIIERIQIHRKGLCMHNFFKSIFHMVLYDTLSCNVSEL